MNTLHRTAAALASAAVLGSLATAALPGTAVPASAAGSTNASVATTPAVRHVPAAEQRAVKRLDHHTIAKLARALALPQNRPLPAGVAAEGADGPAVWVSGTAARATAGNTAASTSTNTATNSVTGVLWPGAASVNPNRQVGKLYFDIDPSPTNATWRHCTGTAINTANKSLVLTAGHCVYDITNRRWYTQLWFYPAYENGRSLGAWPVRTMSTTGNYFNYGASSDDMAIVLVQRDTAGVGLVDRVGGHGIAFNQPVNQMRTSFGYPVTDSRWPGFTASGEDLYYCQGVDTYYSSGSFAGQMLLNCRMTGGASGGPWLSNVNSSWMGIAVSVNSNKGGVGSAWANYLFGPYMGSQESAVFQAYRAA